MFLNWRRNRTPGSLSQSITIIDFLYGEIKEFETDEIGNRIAGNHALEEIYMFYKNNNPALNLACYILSNNRRRGSVFDVDGIINNISNEAFRSPNIPWNDLKHCVKNNLHFLINTGYDYLVFDNLHY